MDLFFPLLIISCVVIVVTVVLSYLMIKLSDRLNYLCSLVDRVDSSQESQRKKQEDLSKIVSELTKSAAFRGGVMKVIREALTPPVFFPAHPVEPFPPSVEKIMDRIEREITLPPHRVGTMERILEEELLRNECERKA